MKTNTCAFLTAIAITLAISSAALAQQKTSGQQKSGMPGMKMDMAQMMQSPHHKLMTGYMNSMTAFATILRDQALKPGALDIEVARAAVAELRHDLDAMETLHQKHMQSMSPEMQSQMQTMMENMDKDRAALRDQVSALETDVQADKPDTAQITAHANALLKQLGMHSKMHGENKPAKKKMTGGMKMDKKNPM